MTPVPHPQTDPFDWSEWIDHRIPPNLLEHPGDHRRARLMTRFGLMGLIFGILFSGFYLLIGHIWGAGIVLLCTLGVAVTPSLMVWRKATEPAGHFFCFTLTTGFFGLCCCEGGVHGHALAWLASVPLCALLLLGIRGSAIWLAIAFLAAMFVVTADLIGIRLATTYDPKWESILSAAGYLALVAFMSTLGLIFERGRAHAHARMELALADLGRSNQRLVEANKEKSEFMSIAAHDLKNPVGVIMANGEMMKMIDETSQLHEMADQVVIASQRMHRLIMDLLDANAIDEGRYASKIEPCDINPLVLQIVEQNTLRAQNKKIAIRLGQHQNLIVRTDASATMQILDNLISNAVKYSPPNTTIHVHLVVEEGNALVQVRDEGPGISEDDQKKLFGKYSRLTAKPTGGESSTGLGLSIAKRLAQVLGGDVLCRSALGAGTTFTLRLPLGAQPDRPENATDAAEIQPENAALSSHRN